MLKKVTPENFKLQTLNYTGGSGIYGVIRGRLEKSIDRQVELNGKTTRRWTISLQRGSQPGRVTDAALSDKSPDKHVLTIAKSTQAFKKG